jgi:5-methylcytosine-specific restriction endonuclease McrA
LAYDPEYYAANKEVHAAYNKAYIERYPEKNKLRHKKYKEANRQKFAEYERKRRAMKRNLKTEPYTTSMVIEIYGTVCYLCNTEIDLNANRRTGYPGWEFGLQIDHVISISNAGNDTIDNVRPTHGLCNSRKNRYTPKFKE